MRIAYKVGEKHVLHRICRTLAFLSLLLPLLAHADAQTQLWKAAELGNTAAIATSIRAGAAVNVQDRDGWTALMFAAASGRTKAVTELLKRDANPNIKTASGETPLIAAVVAGDSAIVRALLDAGASTDARLASGKTAADIARGKRRLDLATMIAKYEKPTRDSTAKVARQPATQGVSPAVIKAFLNEQATFDAKSSAIQQKRSDVENTQLAAAGRERAAAQQRYTACQSSLSQCLSNCSSAGNAEIASAFVGGILSRGSGANANNAMVAAANNAETCTRNCETSYRCEAPR